MKPSNWDKMLPSKKMEIGTALLNSPRGQFVMGQALARATQVMKNEEHPETSNIEDMEIIMECFFPLYQALSTMQTDILRKRALDAAEKEKREDEESDWIERISPAAEEN